MGPRLRRDTVEALSGSDPLPGLRLWRGRAAGRIAWVRCDLAGDDGAYEHQRRCQHWADASGHGDGGYGHGPVLSDRHPDGAARTKSIGAGPIFGYDAL